MAGNGGAPKLMSYPGPRLLQLVIPGTTCLASWPCIQELNMKFLGKTRSQG